MKNKLEEMNQEDILGNEDALLKGLMDAANTVKDDVRKVEISRNGKLFFAFHLTGLMEDEYAECREKATTYIRAKKLGGLKLPEDTDTTAYRSHLIYLATVPEDRKKLWDNKKAWDQLKVCNGPELIDRVLKAGEKEKIVDLIDELSGYDLDKTAKN